MLIVIVFYKKKIVCYGLGVGENPGPSYPILGEAEGFRTAAEAK